MRKNLHIILAPTHPNNRKEGDDAMDDERIIDLYLQRDESAIKATCEKYGSRLRLLSYAITEDLQTAEECENDTYLEAWDFIPPHEPRSYFYSLWRI